MSGRLGVTPAGGGTPVGGATGPRWRLNGVGHIRCYEPQFSMWFSPTTLGRREEPSLLTLGGRRATMADGVGGADRH
jgi:hypothetical protein